MKVKELIEKLQHYEGPDEVSFLAGKLKIVGRENDVSFIDETDEENECRFIVGYKQRLYDFISRNYKAPNNGAFKFYEEE